jgi:SEL1 protein
MRSFWHTLHGGQGGLSIWNLDDDEEPSRSLLLTVLLERLTYSCPVLHMQPQHHEEPRELGDGRQRQGDSSGDGPGEPEHYYDDDGDSWYIGKARDEFRRRRNSPQGIPDGEDDPIQVRIF